VHTARKSGWAVSLRCKALGLVTALTLGRALSDATALPGPLSSLPGPDRKHYSPLLPSFTDASSSSRAFSHPADHFTRALERLGLCLVWFEHHSFRSRSCCEYSKLGDDPLQFMLRHSILVLGRRLLGPI
jgi:hypothetical protein